MAQARDMDTHVEALADIGLRVSCVVKLTHERANAVFAHLAQAVERKRLGDQAVAPGECRLCARDVCKEAQSNRHDEQKYEAPCGTALERPLLAQRLFKP